MSEAGSTAFAGSETGVYYSTNTYYSKVFSKFSLFTVNNKVANNYSSNGTTILAKPAMTVAITL